MSKTICGLDCSECGFKDKCGGCSETNGKPFSGECIIAACSRKRGYKCCGECSDKVCSLKNKIIDEFNKLGIEDMEKITGLNALIGSYINLEYTFSNGHSIKFWEDGRVYLGNQVSKLNSDRCYGLTADENYLLVCEYGAGGKDAEIVILKRRK